jgi:hypothetical protein
MGMYEALLENERRLVEIAARHAGKREAREAGETTWQAMQELPARLLQREAQERRDGVLVLLGHDDTAEAVARLVGASGGQWQGSPSALATAVSSDMDATRFGGHLRKITKYLRVIGLRVTIEHKGREGRRVTIEPFDRDRFDRLVKELNG